MIVYLAGPIEGCTDKQAYAWRELTKDCLKTAGIKCIIPDRMVEGESITNRDRKHITKAHAVLMYLTNAERVSIGTMIEVGWADILGVPIFVVQDRGNLHDYHMLNDIAHSTHRSLMSAWKAVIEHKEAYYDV